MLTALYNSLKIKHYHTILIKILPQSKTTRFNKFMREKMSFNEQERVSELL